MHRLRDCCGVKKVLCAGGDSSYALNKTSGIEGPNACRETALDILTVLPFSPETPPLG